VESRKPAWYGVRLRVLVLVLLAEISVLVSLLRQYPQALWRLSPAAPSTAHEIANPHSYDAREDPEVGSELPQLISILKQLPFPSAGYLVCFVRDCANCVQTDLKALQKKARQHDVTVVILTPGNSRNTQSKAIEHIPVVVDKDGILSKSLNAAWDGRTYLFSSQGRLLWLQKQWGVSYQPAEDTTLVRCLQRLGGKR
jgi:hypothetical protein